MKRVIPLLTVSMLALRVEEKTMKRVIPLLTVSMLAFTTLACTVQKRLQLTSLLEPATTPVPTATPLPPSVRDHREKTEYLEWLVGLEDRIRGLLNKTTAWTNTAVSAYPDVPTTVLQDGRHLADDWAALATEIGSREAPERYKEFHAEFTKAVGMAANSTKMLYDSFTAGNMVTAGEAVALQSRAETALSHAFELVANEREALSVPAQPTSPPASQAITASPPGRVNTSMGIASFLNRSYCVGNRCMSVAGIGLAVVVAILVVAISVRALDRKDTEPPSIASFDFEPKVLSATATGRTITFTVRIVDRQSGVGDPGGDGTVYANFAQFCSPSTKQQAHVAFTGRDRVSGDGRDGVYVSTITLPEDSEVGIWKLTYFELQDNVGNGRTITLDEMTKLGFPVEFHVESTSCSDVKDPAAVNTGQIQGALTHPTR